MDCIQQGIIPAIRIFVRNGYTICIWKFPMYLTNESPTCYIRIMCSDSETSTRNIISAIARSAPYTTEVYSFLTRLVRLCHWPIFHVVPRWAALSITGFLFAHGEFLLFDGINRHSLKLRDKITRPTFSIRGCTNFGYGDQVYRVPHFLFAKIQKALR